MEPLARIRDIHLVKSAGNFPIEIKTDPTNRTFYLSVAILKYFLGEKWLEEHVEDNRRPGYLRLDWENKTTNETQTFRIVDLAELFFNLQDVRGFDHCIQRMKEGDIEGTYAELDLGRMLYSNEIEFHFVERSGKKRDDFDVEITFNGTKLCADAKCKISSTTFSEKTVEHSLNRARSQFPKTRPSIVFVKLPPHWMGGHGTASKDDLTRIAESFLRRTGRVVSVKYYTSFIHWENGYVTHIQAFHEVNNRFNVNRFDPTRNWDMFRDERPLVPNEKNEFTTTPSYWRHLLHLDFPV